MQQQWERALSPSHTRASIGSFFIDKKFRLKYNVVSTLWRCLVNGKKKESKRRKI